MKKFFFLLFTCIIIVASSLCLSSCSNDGFSLVKSITITTSGEEKTFSSYTQPIVKMADSYSYITKSEFEKAPDDRKYYRVNGFDSNSLTKITIDDAIKEAGGSTYYSVVEDDLEGSYYWQYSYTENGNVYYTKWTYSSTYCKFVYVNVKDDTTIVIRSTQVSETTYTVTSYRITKF